jgi:hypothetical protein
VMGVAAGTLVKLPKLPLSITGVPGIDGRPGD